MAKTGSGLAQFCVQALAAGMGYVYGAYGQVCTQALRAYYARQFPDRDLAGGPMYTLAAKWDGKRVADCSGLVSYYLAVDSFGQNPPRRPYFHYTMATQIASIASLPEVPGTILWQPGHVGVYMGNGSVIEAQSTATGVVRTSMPGRWQKWYWPQQISYSNNPVFIDNPSLDPSNFIFTGCVNGIANGIGSGARGRGYSVITSASIRQVYELILEALNSLTTIPFDAMNNSLSSSVSSVGNANSSVDPDPGEGYITGSTNAMTARFNSLLAQANTLETNIKDYASIIGELSERVNAL